jgi:hypothetical protein
MSRHTFQTARSAPIRAGRTFARAITPRPAPLEDCTPAFLYFQIPGIHSARKHSLHIPRRPCAPPACKELNGSAGRSGSRSLAWPRLSPRNVRTAPDSRVLGGNSALDTWSRADSIQIRRPPALLKGSEIEVGLSLTDFNPTDGPVRLYQSPDLDWAFLPGWS